MTKADIKIKGLRGINNVHFAPRTAEGFAVPTPITLAKAIENKLKYEGSQTWADNMIVDGDFLYAGGEGKLSVVGTSTEEDILLFGLSSALGGAYSTDIDEAPEGAYLFEMQKKNGHRRLYVVYSCKNSPSDISSKTIEDGKAEWEVKDIEYQIGSYHKDGVNYIFFYIDTDAPNVKAEQVTKWYTAVQFPEQPSESGFNSIVAPKEQKSK